VNAYAVNVGPKAQDWFDECRDQKLQQRLAHAINALALDPRPPKCKKLVGEKQTWRIRVGDHRILYQIHDGQLTILTIRIGNRRDIYR